jgi:hypothetical protein
MTTIAAPEIETINLEEPSIFEEIDDPNARSHMVNGDMNLHVWIEGMEPRELVEAAVLGGYELTALCGFKWVPKGDPDKHDICEKCLKIWNSLA